MTFTGVLPGLYYFESSGIYINTTQIELNTDDPGSTVFSVVEPVKVLFDLLLSVEDEEGNPLSGVNVNTTSQPLGQQPLSCIIDGEYTFEKIVPGRYVFSFEKEKYRTATSYIQVNEAGILYSADTVVLSLIPYDYRPIFLLATLIGFISVGYIYWSSNKKTKPIPITP